jgi:hypothetical protein
VNKPYIFISSSATVTAIKRERHICKIHLTICTSSIHSNDCAIAKDGTLKDANNIDWFNDANDLTPLPQTHPLIVGSSASSVTSLDCAGRNLCEELDQYLAAPLEDVDDVVGWWGVSTLYCFAHQSPDQFLL